MSAVMSTVGSESSTCGPSVIRFGSCPSDGGLIKLPADHVLRLQVQLDAELLEEVSMLAVDLRSQLVLNAALCRAELLLPGAFHRLHQVSSGEVARGTMQVVRLAQPAILSVTDRVDLAVHIPEEALPTIAHSFFLNVSWALSVRLLPSGRNLLREFSLAVPGKSFEVLSIMMEHKVDQFVVRDASSILPAIPGSLDDVILMKHHETSEDSTIWKSCSFDIKHDNFPFAVISVKPQSSTSEELTLTLDITFKQDKVAGLKCSLVQTECMERKYVLADARNEIVQQIKVKQLDRLRHVQSVSVRLDAPRKLVCPLRIGQAWSITYGVALNFSLVNGTSFECLLPLT